MEAPVEIQEEAAKLEYRLLQIELQEKARKDFLYFSRYVWEGVII